MAREGREVGEELNLDLRPHRRRVVRPQAVGLTLRVGKRQRQPRAAPRALAQWLAIVRKDEVGATFQQALPILGVDGSLSGTGKKLPGRGRIFAKTGTTVGPGTDGKPHLVAQCLAGYIETQAGRRVAYALMVNNAGPLKQLIDVTEVFEDQAVISNAIFEAL